MSEILEWSAFWPEDPFSEIVEARKDELPKWKAPDDAAEAAAELAAEYLRDIWGIWFGDDDNAVIIVQITGPEEFKGLFEVELNQTITARGKSCDDPRVGP